MEHRMTEPLSVQQMAQRLKSADNILILCHKNPDGDTVGCGSALYYALKALDKNAAVLCSDTIPARYAFTNAHLFKGEFEPETVVAVDVAGLQLFGEGNGVPRYSRHVDLCIDHHAGNSGYADFTLLDGSAAAAAELMYRVILEMGVDITPHIADCLYTGVATDTGCFRFSATTANTHLVAAKLIEAGCHVEELNTLLFDTKPRARMEAERIARNHLEYYLDGRCALIYLTRDEIEQTGVDPADLEELTSLPISIEGVKVGLTLRQQPGGSYRISVRTAKGVDACAIARRLGGGGHNRAAGCELLGNLENAKNAILAEVEAEHRRGTKRPCWGRTRCVVCVTIRLLYPTRKEAFCADLPEFLPDADPLPRCGAAGLRGRQRAQGPPICVSGLQRPHRHRPRRPGRGHAGAGHRAEKAGSWAAHH